MSDYAHAMKEAGERIACAKAERRDLYAQWAAIGFLATALERYAHNPGTPEELLLRRAALSGIPVGFKNRWRSYRREKHGKVRMDMGTPYGIVLQLRQVELELEAAKAERSRLYRARDRHAQPTY